MVAVAVAVCTAQVVLLLAWVVRVVAVQALLPHLQHKVVWPILAAAAAV